MTICVIFLFKVTKDSKESKNRRRRSIDSDNELLDAIQNIEIVESSTDSANGDSVTGDWSSTPCAKRFFCEAMVKRGLDSQVSMNKKMFGLVKM